jgi:hypothetical protein
MASANVLESGKSAFVCTSLNNSEYSSKAFIWACVKEVINKNIPKKNILREERSDFGDFIELFIKK